MSYESVVIANGVDAFFRLNGLDTHPVLADVSGNGNHAECFDGEDPDAHIHGIASPIETDAGGAAMSGKVGFLTDPTNRLNTFHWQGWIYNFDTSSPQTLICRSGHWSSSSANILGIGAGGSAARARLRIGGVTYDLTYPVLLGFWYYLVVVYNAGAVQLWVNGVLGDEETGVVGNMDVGGDTAFFLGAQQFNQGVWFSWGMDEPAFGVALNQAQIVQNYESAFNAVFLQGTSNVIPTAILYSDIEPTPTHFPFRHNWSDPLIERISFRTNISTARTGSEEGTATRPRPRREIEFIQVLRDDTERRKLRAQLWANQHRKWFIPILEDREQLVVPVLAGAATIPATTALKDYVVGGYVELRQLDDRGVITNAEVLEIGSFTDSAITPTTTPVNSYDAFVSTVGPVRRGYLDSQLSIRGHTDSVEEATVIARLLPDGEEASPNRITSWNPTLKYRDYEVFDPAVWQSNDWSEPRDYDVQRVLHDVDYETGAVSPQSDTAGAAEAFSYHLPIKGRVEIAAFLGWFYARAGSLTYLWVPTMQRDFEVVGVVDEFLTVAGTNYSDNYALAEARRDLAFIYNDNTLELRRVVGFSSTVNETLELDAPVPPLTNLRSVSLLKFCRLDSDVLEIAKVTDDLWVFAWRFRELLETPAGVGASSLSPSASRSISLSPSASGSPSASLSLSTSPSSSRSPSASASPSSSTSHSPSLSVSPSGSASPSASVSPSGSASPSP